MVLRTLDSGSGLDHFAMLETFLTYFLVLMIFFIRSIENLDQNGIHHFPSNPLRIWNTPLFLNPVRILTQILEYTTFPKSCENLEYTTFPKSCENPDPKSAKLASREGGPRFIGTLAKSVAPTSRLAS